MGKKYLDKSLLPVWQPETLPRWPSRYLDSAHLRPSRPVEEIDFSHSCAFRYIERSFLSFHNSAVSLQRHPARLGVSAAPLPHSDASAYMSVITTERLTTWKTLNSSIEIVCRTRTLRGVLSAGWILFQDNRICQVNSRCWLYLQMSERCAASDGQ